jgi:hypothetical protein
MRQRQVAEVESAVVSPFSPIGNVAGNLLLAKQEEELCFAGLS